MDPRTFPTKGNLMLAKNSLSLARQGYDLMDKKRNILIRELMDLIEEARTIQETLIRLSCMLINAFSVPISRTESAQSSFSPIRFRSKIPSRSRHAVSWELKFLM